MRTAPNGGSEVTTPTAGQVVYFHVDYGNISSVNMGAYRSVIRLNGNDQCYYDASSSTANTNYIGWCISGWTTTAGSHTLTAVIDVNNQVTKSNETNNTATKSLTVPGLLEELKKIRKSEVSQKELDDTKSFYTGYFSLQLETPEQVATQVLNTEIYGIGLDYIKNYRKSIKAVSMADVLRVAKEHIDPNDLKIVVVANTERAKESLEKLGKVKVVSFTE